MAKTLDQTGKAPQQEYRTKEEVQPAFRPRYDPQVGKTADATKDIDSLMSSKSSMTKQEHTISTGMARRMASDHVAELNNEINFIDSQMGDTDSRDEAILRLQSSIASTAGVTEGLSGDAAMAYDELYINTARNMTGKAISVWQGQQKKIDENTLKTEFQTFMNNTYADLDPQSQQIHLAAWGERFSSFGDVSNEDIMLTGLSSQVDSYAAQVKANPDGDYIAMANKTFGAYADVTEDGNITFKTQNVKVNKAVAGSIYSAIQPGIEKEKLATLAEAKAQITSDREIQDAYVAGYNAEIAELDKQYKDQIEDDPSKKTEYEEKKKAVEEKYQTNVAQNTSNKEIDGVLVSREASKTAPYTTWSRGIKRAPGSKQAYGKYQFTKARAQEAWDLAGIKGTMVHGTQTPDQQDKMYAAHRDDLKKHLTTNRVPVTPDNVYALHQLGKAGGLRLMLGKTATKDDLKNMLNNLSKADKIKYSDVMTPYNRKAIPLLWQNKFRTHSAKVANQIRLSAKLDINDMQAKEFIRTGQKKDAAKDAALSGQLAKVLAAGRADGTLDEESQKSIQDKIDELMSNGAITNHDRETHNTMVDTYTQVQEDAQDQKRESEAVVLAENATNAAWKVDHTVDWNDTFMKVLQGQLGEDYDIKFKKTAREKAAAITRAHLSNGIVEHGEDRNTNIVTPLKVAESTNATGAMFAPLFDQWDSMTKDEQKRLEKAHSKYYASEKAVVENAVARGLSQPRPKLGEDTGSGPMYSEKSIKAVDTALKAQFNGLKQNARQGSPEATKAMDTLLNSGKHGIDGGVLDMVTEEYKSMGDNIHTFVKEFTKDPTIFKNRRFRDSLLSQMDRKQQENFYAFEVFTEVEMRKLDAKTKEGEEVDFTQVADVVGNSEAYIALRETSSSWLTSDAKKAIEAKEFSTENYDSAMKGLGATPMHSTKKDVYTRILNKMVKSGLDEYIPSILSGMMLSDDTDTAEGLRLQPTAKITQFMLSNKEFREDPALLISQVTGQDYDHSKKSADMNNIRIEEDLYSAKRDLYMVIMYPDNTYSRIKMDENIKPIKSSAPKTYAQLGMGAGPARAISGDYNDGTGLNKKMVDAHVKAKAKRKKELEDARL